MKNRIILLTMSTLLWAGVTYAQSPWLSDSRMTSFSMEWDKPLFNDRFIDRGDVSGASSVLFLTGRFRVNENLRLVTELPISHFGYESDNPVGDDNSTVIGNIYVGGIYDIHTANPDNHAFVELGVRIPTTPDPNLEDRFGGITGAASESSDRMEAFMFDSWTIPAVANLVARVDGPFAVKTRLGTIYDIFTDDLKNEDNSLWLLYGVTALYREEKVEAHLGFAGRNQYVGNPSSIDFWDSGYTQLRAGIARPFRNVTVGVHARLPLGKNYTDLLDFAYGFNLEFHRAR